MMMIKQTISDLVRPIKRRYKCSKELRRTAIEYAALNCPAPVMYDVGARWGISKPYDKLKLFPEFFSVGFEPDIEEAKRLEKLGLFSKAVPAGLGDKNEHRILNMARDPGSSSIFKPDMTEIARHTGSNQFETVEEITISLVTLAEACKEYDLPQPDYIKVDCEGAEEIIFSGAGPVLDHVIGVSFEARVFEFYKGEPRLQRLLDFFIDRGFILLDLTPVGFFHGEKVMFDVAMIRHPEQFTNDRDFMIGKIFSLLFENLLYSERIEEFRRNFRAN